ncbi:zinc finger homeobox protein 3 [Anopheles maculipalpis]|uniref:zinc finger homeobox protein 3 n=1 Tax=Anopheles maculipalpis TaxID=1496333 RepID=UPI002158ED56|nr:zinc finger homeobox protein 3 [Anopheles maculipalpis]
MASIRHNGRTAASWPLQLIIGGVCVLLTLQDHPHSGAVEATIPTIDNIVKILQSPVVQQLILPRPLIAADPSVAADAPAGADTPKKESKKPSPMSDEPSKVSQKEKREQSDESDVPPIRAFLIPRTRSLPGCPLCDASVYSYCDEKVYHDACCCGSINGAVPFGGGGGGGGGFGGFGGFGRQFGGPGGFGGGCGFKGCSFLYANSCYEHQLIVNCCCNSPY